MKYSLLKKEPYYMLIKTNNQTVALIAFSAAVIVEFCVSLTVLGIKGGVY